MSCYRAASRWLPTANPEWANITSDPNQPGQVPLPWNALRSTDKGYAGKA
jgi:hypothetical protein